jgi:nitroimidazol reductase NimA-like FMN-containing flavoprotein (pyridoxamine 5'-phosphate oxidase superfamily)
VVIIINLQNIPGRMSIINGYVDNCHFFSRGRLDIFTQTKNMFGNLSTVEIDDFIKHQVVGRIGCHDDNITYVVPISFAYDGNYVYGHTEEGLKINIMRKNPKVCFEVDHLENMANWKSVICQGEFEELTDADGRNAALKILLERPLPFITSKTVQLSPQWPFPPSDYSLIEGVVYRILIKEKTGRFENGIEEPNNATLTK